MTTFGEKFEAAPQWQRNRYDRLRAATGLDTMTDIERCCLLWIAGWEEETADTLRGIFHKIRNDRKPGIDPELSAHLKKLANAGMKHECGLYPQE